MYDVEMCFGSGRPVITSSARELMQDLAGRVRGHIQLTTDGNRLYLNAVEDAFVTTFQT